jgi:hypothetical protein
MTDAESTQTQGPASRPCESCPYRKDVPAGVWAAKEYEKLPEYDLPTPFQPMKMFLCHLFGKEPGDRRVCAGWVATHDMEENLSIRVCSAGKNPDISVETFNRIRDYKSPIPVFSSGAEAAGHGLLNVENPSPEAVKAAKKIIRTKPDIQFG